MVIKRKYATYGQLEKDDPSFFAMDYAIRSCGYTKDNVHEMIARVSNVLVCNTNIESGFPAQAFHMFMEKFEELDKTDPYDNGFTYRDVTGSICFPSRKGNALLQVLISQHTGLPAKIVQVVAFEHDGDNVKPVEPWSIPQIIL